MKSLGFKEVDAILGKLWDRKMIFKKFKNTILETKALVQKIKKYMRRISKEIFCPMRWANCSSSWKVWISQNY